MAQPNATSLEEERHRDGNRQQPRERRHLQPAQPHVLGYFTDTHLKCGSSTSATVSCQAPCEAMP